MKSLETSKIHLILHKLALKLNTPKHGCFEYRIATPHADVADAVQDELQDSGIIR